MPAAVEGALLEDSNWLAKSSERILIGWFSLRQSVSHRRLASSVELLEVFVEQLEKLLPCKMSGELLSSAFNNFIFIRFSWLLCALSTDEC